MTEEEQLKADLKLVFATLNGKPKGGPPEDLALQNVVTTLALGIHRASRAFVEIAEHIKQGKTLLK